MQRKVLFDLSLHFFLKVRFIFPYREICIKILNKEAVSFDEKGVDGSVRLSRRFLWIWKYRAKVH